MWRCTSLTSRRAASFSCRWAGLFAVGRKKLASRIASISAGGRHLPGAPWSLGDRSQHVVDGLAVAEFGGEAGLEAEQVAQPVGLRAVEERGQLAVTDGDRVAVGAGRGLDGGTAIVGRIDLETGVQAR